MPKFNAAFREWFGDSKVAKPDGSPMVVYHATGADKDFTSFKRKLSDLGIHFGTLGQAQDRLDYLAAGRRPSDHWRIIPAYLSIQSPLRLPDLGFWNWENVEYALRDKFGEDAVRQALRSSYSANGKTNAMRQLIMHRGYDGVVYKNTGETAGAAELSAEVDVARKTMTAAQKARGKPVNCYDRDDQECAEYQAMARAEKAHNDFREAHAEDSWIAFEPWQIKSVYNDGMWSKKADIRSNPDDLELEAERILRELVKV